MEFARQVWRLLKAIPGAVIAVLDWLVQIAERLLVLALASVVLWYGYEVLRGRASAQASAVIAEIADHWKAVILILIPLFYRTARIFLERVESAFGMKARPRRSEEEEEEDEPADED